MKKLNKIVLEFINKKPKDYGQDITDSLDSNIQIKTNINIDNTGKVRFSKIKALFRKKF